MDKFAAMVTYATIPSASNLRKTPREKPLILTSAMFIYLSNLNTEWFNKIFIQAKLGELEFFHYNGTSLFITNMRTSDESDTATLCSIYVENFYKSKKLWTLTVDAMDSHTSLFGLKE
uniref:Uncharacterized protein n=1 Tax=Romanomermis culicivorax TaxID=13658 RepID=A0A915JGB1_ROMCU